MRRDNGERLEAELTRERYEELSIDAGHPVWVKPRRLQLFDAAPAPEPAPAV